LAGGSIDGPAADRAGVIIAIRGRQSIASKPVARIERSDFRAGHASSANPGHGFARSGPTCSVWTGSIWTAAFRRAKLADQCSQETGIKKIHREDSMTMLRKPMAVLAAVFALVSSSARAEMKTEWVEYGHGDMKLKGYLAYDDKAAGRRPAILMIHDRAGMQPYTQKHAETYAKLGYVTFVADFFGYGQGILPKDVPEAQAQMGIYTKDRALMKSRAQVGYDTLLKNPMVDAGKVALIGYCFGGMVGVEFGSTGVPLAANIAIHGSFFDHPAGWAANAKGRFLILHGAEDVPYPLEKVAEVYNELRKAKKDFQMEFYSGAGHGFSVPKNKDEERANELSIATTTRTLREVFGI
jgi:dienelactone hydrolase